LSGSPTATTSRRLSGAKRYRDIIGPRPAPNARGGGDERESAAGQPGLSEDPGHASGAEGAGAAQGGADGGPDVGSLKDALERACERARGGQLQQLNEEADLAATLEQVTRRGQAADACKGAGTGAPTRLGGTEMSLGTRATPARA
jgi:hypothetical protein